MKNLTKKLFMFASVLGAALLLSGCMMDCPNKKAHHHKSAQRVQPVAIVEERPEGSQSGYQRV